MLKFSGSYLAFQLLDQRVAVQLVGNLSANYGVVSLTVLNSQWQRVYPNWVTNGLRQSPKVRHILLSEALKQPAKVDRRVRLIVLYLFYMINQLMRLDKLSFLFVIQIQFLEVLIIYVSIQEPQYLVSLHHCHIVDCICQRI